jgi:hypothetical protein
MMESHCTGCVASRPARPLKSLKISKLNSMTTRARGVDGAGEFRRLRLLTRPSPEHILEVHLQVLRSQSLVFVRKMQMSDYTVPALLRSHYALAAVLQPDRTRKNIETSFALRSAPRDLRTP